MGRPGNEGAYGKGRLRQTHKDGSENRICACKLDLVGSEGLEFGERVSQGMQAGYLHFHAIWTGWTVPEIQGSEGFKPVMEEMAPEKVMIPSRSHRKP